MGAKGRRLRFVNWARTQSIQEIARRLVPELRAKGAQIVAAIPHSGYERGETPRFAENPVARLAWAPGIGGIPTCPPAP